MKIVKRRIKYSRIFVVLIILFLIVSLILKITSLRITNIYISGNEILKDQEIIDIAKLSDYPKTIKNSTWTIEDRLNKNPLIKKSKVSKENLTIIKIEVEENKPIFYNTMTSKTILEDGSEIDNRYDVPILINYVPDFIFLEFKQKMSLINKDVLSKISEIKYDPNDIDDKRFLMTMIDGNYVYLTISRFEIINNYISIIKNFNDKKGILYLDVGNVFEYFEE